MILSPVRDSKHSWPEVRLFSWAWGRNFILLKGKRIGVPRPGFLCRLSQVLSGQHLEFLGLSLSMEWAVIFTPFTDLVSVKEPCRPLSSHTLWDMEKALVLGFD